MASFFLSQIFVFGQREEAHSSFRALAASISPTPTDVLQVLAEMSWDTLLLLVGLAFVAVAVVGNISGKISPGKEGRIAAAILGGCLVAGGIWYHMTMHRFRVSDIAVVSPGPQEWSLPDSDKAAGLREWSQFGRSHLPV
jgi:heme/copper-type cytochrome/quinol oxidase subunit 3